MIQLYDDVSGSRVPVSQKIPTQCRYVEGRVKDVEEQPEGNA